MSGGERGNVTKETGSAEKSGEIVVDGTRKTEEKSGQCDSTKIEFRADKEEETADGELLKEVTARDVTPQNSEREDNLSAQKKGTSSESCNREGIVTAQNYCNDMREFDADPLSTWSQSSGSVSYDSGWSLHSLIKNLTFNAKRADLQPVLPLIQAEKKQVVSGLSPSMVNLNEHMLSEMNNALRWRSHLGDIHTHIAITNKKSPNERRGIIAKLFDDSLHEYLSSSSKEKRQICLRVECGGRQSPSLTITCAPGQQEQRYYKETNAYAVSSQAQPNEYKSQSATTAAQQIDKIEPELHYPNYRSLSSISVACQPMASFSHCSITDHVRKVRRGRSQLRLLDSVTSSE